MKKQTKDVQDYLKLGEQAYISNDYKLAISQFNMAKKINQQAVKKHCDEIITSNPNHVVALIIRADILENLGEYKAALKDYEAALAVLPKNNSLYKHYQEERDLIEEKEVKANASANNKRKLQTIKITSPSKKSKNTFMEINQELFSSPSLQEEMPSQLLQKKVPDNNSKPKTVSAKHTNKKQDMVAVETIPLNSFKILPMSKLSKKDFSSFPTKSRRKREKTAEEMQEKEERNKAIGRWGESLVYLKLKSDYEIKYSNNENFSAKEILIEQQKGVIDKQFTLSCINRKTKERMTLILNWHNFGEESYKPKDITITKWVDGQPSIERVIEVKATESSTPWNAKFSKEEIEQMQQYREYYRIFRVYSARQKSATIQKLKNPYEQIFPAASKQKGNHQPKVTISKIKLRI